MKLRIFTGLERCSNRRAGAALTRLVLAGVLALSLVTAAGAEVVPGETGDDGPSGLQLLPDGPFRLTCWQNGVKILEEDGLSELSVALSRMGSRTSARSAGSGERAVLFSANAYTTCMVKSSDRIARVPAGSGRR